MRPQAGAGPRGQDSFVCRGKAWRAVGGTQLWPAHNAGPGAASYCPRTLAQARRRFDECAVAVGVLLASEEPTSAVA